MTDQPHTNPIAPDEKKVSLSAMDAALLSGAHIDRIVSFDWRFPGTNVAARVTGMIREIHHDGLERTWVHLLPHDDDLSGGDKQEFELKPGTRVWLFLDRASKEG